MRSTASAVASPSGPGFLIPPRRTSARCLSVEHCDHDGVSGRALNTAFPNAPVCLDVIVDGVFAGYAYTEAKTPNGDRGFDLRFAPALDPSRPH